MRSDWYQPRLIKRGERSRHWQADGEGVRVRGGQGDGRRVSVGKVAMAGNGWQWLAEVAMVMAGNVGKHWWRWLALTGGVARVRSQSEKLRVSTSAIKRGWGGTGWLLWGTAGKVEAVVDAVAGRQAGKVSEHGRGYQWRGMVEAMAGKAGKGWH